MPRRAALEVLRKVLDAPRARAGEELAGLPRMHGLAERDRVLAREICLGVLRSRGALEAVVGSRTRRPLPQADPLVRLILLLGAYQILYLDRVPAHAAVDTAVRLARDVGKDRAAGFVNALLRRVVEMRVAARTVDGPDPRRSIPRGDGSFMLVREPVFPPPGRGLAAHLAARWSHPRWMVERFLAEHGPDGTRQILLAGLARPPVSLRPAAGREVDLAAGLRVAAVPFEEEGRCLLLRGAGRVEDLPGFGDGWFAVQDPTPAEVVPALAAAPGAAVLDVCAAPGGKSLALSEAVGPTGVVVATDVSERRLARLRAEIARRGIGNVHVVTADGTEPDALPHGAPDLAERGFDGVVVDVPCSNTGVLGRRVEARWRLRGPDDMHALAAQARTLLAAALTRLRPAGRAVYSTCSVDDAENGAVVRAVLADRPDLALLDERLTLPLAGRRDGGYIAVIGTTAAA